MVEAPLLDTREYVEGLAVPDGDFYVVCGRTGSRPVPTAGLRFPDRETAREAARATEHYRAALRRYDPDVPHYDPIVCEATDTTAAPDRRRDRRDLPPG